MDKALRAPEGKEESTKQGKSEGIVREATQLEVVGEQFINAALLLFFFPRTIGVLDRLKRIMYIFHP